jgi:hypothetical protein
MPITTDLPHFAKHWMPWRRLELLLDHNTGAGRFLVEMAETAWPPYI